MQPTQVQVEQCLQALHGEKVPSLVLGGVGAQPATVPPGVLEALQGVPAIRDDRLADARRRMAGGAPTADDLAERMVGRLVCDRIR